MTAEKFNELQRRHAERVIAEKVAQTPEYKQIISAIADIKSMLAAINAKLDTVEADRGRGR